jgi:hypothetical protein
LIPGTVSKVTVPVGRKAASLCILRTHLRTVFRTGQYEHYTNMLQPAYVFEYADGTRCVCDWEMRRHFNDIGTQCFYYGSPLGPSLGHFLMPSCRLGYAANTLSGAGANVFINEIVNPYPDKEVRNLLIQLPNPELRDYTYEFHDAIFAVTGVEPVEWDLKYWSQRPPKPLLPANAVIPPGAKKVEGMKMADDSKLPVRTAVFTLPKASEVQAINFRMLMPGGYPVGATMLVKYSHADLKISVSSDGKEWAEIASIKGCTGMDGEHILAFAPKSATLVKVVMDASPYGGEENVNIGLISFDVYEK